MRSLCSRDGGHWPTLTEVSANLRAGADWTRRRDLPDLDAWADFAAAPALVHERMINRLREDRCPSVAHSFPLPKPGKDELRRMAWLHPYDDLFLRILAGRLAPAIEAALRPDVFSYRLAGDPPGWSVRDTRESFELLRQRARALLHDARCNAVAVSDLRNYYPSIEPRVLVDALRQTASPRGAVALIGEFLRELVPMGAPRGLPIGPEASGLLGNAMLLEVDEALSRRAQGHIRYMDDSWIFLQGESDWPDVVETYAAAVSDLGLEINTSKVGVHQFGSEGAEKAIEHGLIAYLTSGAARYRTPQMSADELLAEAEREEPDWRLVGFYLGSLRYRQSSLALPILYEQPRILREMPRHTGHYLAELTNCTQSRREMDRDWLVEQATARPTAPSLAGQLHLCRVASQLPLGKEHGRRLEEFATDTSLRHHVPLQAWAARAWGSSKAHTPRRAVEYACHLGDFSVRRGFALTVSPATSTRRTRSCWRRKLQSLDPDLEPTLARLD